MKNQNDLIGLIVAIVVGLGGISTFAFFMKPTVPAVTAPAPVNTTEAALPQGSVTYVTALPGGGGGTGGGGGFGAPAGGRPGGGSPVAGMQSSGSAGGFAPSRPGSAGSSKPGVSAQGPGGGK
jgi:hypothetical protein